MAWIVLDETERFAYESGDERLGIWVIKQVAPVAAIGTTESCHTFKLFSKCCAVWHSARNESVFTQTVVTAPPTSK